MMTPFLSLDHRHCPVLIGLRQRAEENIDGMVYIFMIVFPESQNIGYDLQIIFGRNHIDMVALHAHSILSLHYRHRCFLAQYICQQALVVRRQMLDDDKRHSGITGKKCQKLLQCFQTARRSADPHNAVGLRFMLELTVIVFLTHYTHISFLNLKSVISYSVYYSVNRRFYAIFILYLFP